MNVILITLVVFQQYVLRNVATVKSAKRHLRRVNASDQEAELVLMVRTSN